jgi:hypothetical protein
VPTLPEQMIRLQVLLQPSSHCGDLASQNHMAPPAPGAGQNSQWNLALRIETGPRAAL